jgi:hypothetical protein
VFFTRGLPSQKRLSKRTFRFPFLETSLEEDVSFLAAAWCFSPAAFLPRNVSRRGRFVFCLQVRRPRSGVKLVKTKSGKNVDSLYGLIKGRTLKVDDVGEKKALAVLWVGLWDVIRRT